MMPSLVKQVRQVFLRDHVRIYEDTRRKHVFVDIVNGLGDTLYQLIFMLSDDKKVVLAVAGIGKMLEEEGKPAVLKEPVPAAGKRDREPELGITPQVPLGGNT